MVAASQATKSSQRRRAQGHTLVFRKADRRETRFAQLVAQGHTLAKAYQEISGAGKKETCERQGVRWNARPAVAAEIIRQRALLTEDGAATRAEKRHILSQVMRREDTPPSVVVSAVAVDNRMTGDDEPFRKAAGDDLRVQFFVLRIGDADTRASEAMNVTAAQIQTREVAPESSAQPGIESPPQMP